MFSALGRRVQARPGHACSIKRGNAHKCLVHCVSVTRGCVNLSLVKRSSATRSFVKQSFVHRVKDDAQPQWPTQRPVHGQSHPLARP
jgi:hypothetical protein